MNHLEEGMTMQPRAQSGGNGTPLPTKKRRRHIAKWLFCASIGLAFVALGIRPALAQAERESQFELSEATITQWAADPLHDLSVMLDCAGPVHPAANDCELHIGAKLDDPSIGDFTGIVLEPPNVCAEHGKNWRTAINALTGKHATAHGFLRAWPEHLTSGSGCSNPNHILEVHPLLTLQSGNQDVLDFTDKLRVVPDLGYKDPTIVNAMMDLRVWICKGCAASGDNNIAFDYCFGNNCTRQSASNFARFHATPITSTIKENSAKDFLSAIARVVPVDEEGNEAGDRHPSLKIYALKGTAFYDMLDHARSQGQPATIDLIGIFTIDFFSIKRALPTAAPATWVRVPYPVALIVFGDVPANP